jgi:hypothetical protein
MQFIETGQKRCNVNDSNLLDWALNIAGEMGIGDFQASESYNL